MIKEIKVDWIHWVKSTISFWKRTAIVWQSKLWKTTILNTIMAAYSWYFPWYGKSLPEWNAEIKTDSWDILISNKKVVSNLILDTEKADLIRYIVPWNFFKLTKWTPEQRAIITKLMWLDTSILENIVSDIKEIKTKIKEFDNKKEQITLDIIRLEEEKEQYIIIEEPIEPELIPDNSEEILNAYNKYIDWINKENRKIQAEYSLALEDYNRDINTANSYKSNEIQQLTKDIFNNKTKLDSIQREAEQLKSQVPYNCNSCGTLIQPKDNSVRLNGLRIEYSQINESNKLLEVELEKLKEEKLQVINNIKQPLRPEIKDVWNIYSLHDKSTIVWIPYKEWNTNDVAEYNNKYLEYSQLKTKVEMINKELELKANQLKDLDPTKLDLELRKKEKAKTEFNKEVEDKVKSTWLDIRLFETLKNGNVSETFAIYDEEWYNYNATSSWNQIYIEVLIAKLFVDYLWLDFILVDRWESVWINLKKKVYEAIWSLQLIVTQVTDDNEIKVLEIK